MQTLRRQQHMPFGTELQDDGSVSFRLWAPAARVVAVCLGDSHNASSRENTVLPMQAGEDGWFHITTSLARAGTLYRFRINEEIEVPDPASRYQPNDVHGPSEVIDPTATVWHDGAWHGRPWEESILYELHVGCFTSQGTFSAVEQKLNYLVDLGITAIELMPVADFPGARNWGYDGTYLFAPDSRYGRPEDLKALVDAAHARGLMVILDVVYNHFGPEGNYLHLYAPDFFTEHHHTAWGAAINFDTTHSYWVRQFFIHNALYWLEEYHFDGLRLDAVHAIMDDTQPDILCELAQRVQQQLGEHRHIHLILENDHNAAHYLKRNRENQPAWYVAQWNDDIHHALHVLLTQETDGYYQDYADAPLPHLGRCLAEGFAYQGEVSAYRHGDPRGEPSQDLPATAFVSFSQNHDQVGNRAFGERLDVLTTPAQRHAALAILLLAPAPPLLFMGQEWGCTQPFLFFCDFGPELAASVVSGRRNEFARFARFHDPASRELIPDPMSAETFTRSRLDWQAIDESEHRDWLALYRKLLTLRQRSIVPRLRQLAGNTSDFQLFGDTGLSVRWTLGDGSELLLQANPGNLPVTQSDRPAYPLLYSTHANPVMSAEAPRLPPWSVAWYLQNS
ncbi:MAG: malto-oligosyltrehalose trehalohydrolase [Gammaproteobacteria bacterium]